MKKIILLLLLFTSMHSFAQYRNDDRDNRYHRGHNSRMRIIDYPGTFTGGTIQLVADRRYTSANKQYYFSFQSDGNLVVYRVSDGRSLWASNTANQNVTKAVYQNDGNLVLTNSSGVDVWNGFAAQQAKNLPANGRNIYAYQKGRGTRNNTLTMQDDGNLVVYSGRGNKVLWASDTNQ